MELAIKDAVFPLMADGWMLLALAYLVRVSSGGDPIGSGLTGGLARWQLRRAMEFMREQLSGNISVNDVAASCELSSGYFSRSFKKSTGVSPHHWLVSTGKLSEGSSAHF
jgi:AraC family transcriptional regulator